MVSKQRSTALAWCQSFAKLDLEGNLALRAPNCTHTIAPASTGFPPAMTNEQFAAHLSTLKPLLSDFPVTPKEIFEQGNQVTVWATSTATFREEAKDDEAGTDWSYHGEYIFLLLFNEAGDKIERIVEFLDSKAAAGVLTLAERAKRNLEARK